MSNSDFSQHTAQKEADSIEKNNSTGSEPSSCPCDKLRQRRYSASNIYADNIPSRDIGQHKAFGWNFLEVCESSCGNLSAAAADTVTNGVGLVGSIFCGVDRAEPPYNSSRASRSYNRDFSALPGRRYTFKTSHPEFGCSCSFQLGLGTHPPGSGGKAHMFVVN